MQQLTPLHVVGLLATIALIIGIGIYSGRKVKSAADFSSGGSRAGAWIVCGAIMGTLVSGQATIGTAQLAYTMGLSAWWFTLGSGIAFILMGFFYAGRLRATGLETIPQYLQRNYGSRAAEAAGLISSAGILFSVVASCFFRFFFFYLVFIRSCFKNTAFDKFVERNFFLNVGTWRIMSLVLRM